MRTKHFIPILILFVIITSKAQSISVLNKELEKSKSLKESSKIESDLGRIYFGKGDFLTAQKFFFAALEKAEKIKNDHLIASACNNISATYMETENDSQAENYAKRSIDFNKKIRDHEGLADAYNSLANVYYFQEKDHLSLHYFSESIKERKIVKDSAGLFAGYKNLGSNLFEIGKTDEAIKTIEQSLKYISKKTDSAKWIGSYLTLSQAYLYSGKSDKAKYYLDQCYQYIHNYKDKSKVEDYYYTVSQYYERTGNTTEAFKNFKLYAKYRDSVISTAKNRQLSELNLKYETEKKQNLINHQNFELKQKNTLLIFIGAFFLIAIIVAYFIYKNYRFRQDKKLQKEIFRQKEVETKALFEGEQNERIRIARDLHDSVGQMLSLIKMNLSSQEQNLENEKVQNLVDKTISEVRTISHNLIPEELNFGIIPALENLADKVNSSSSTKMEIDIPDEIRTLEFQRQNELSIYRIVQEVVNNMIKHADATSVNLLIKKTENILIINIRDNGKGLDNNSISNSSGIGWKNINARVHMMDGKIKIESEKLAGTQIEITLPQNG